MISTRGARLCFPSSLRMSRLAACLLRLPLHRHIEPRAMLIHRAPQPLVLFVDRDHRQQRDSTSGHRVGAAAQRASLLPSLRDAQLLLASFSSLLSSCGFLRILKVRRVVRVVLPGLVSGILEPLQLGVFGDTCLVTFCFAFRLSSAFVGLLADTCGFAACA